MYSHAPFGHCEPVLAHETEPRVWVSCTRTGPLRGRIGDRTRDLAYMLTPVLAGETIPKVNSPGLHRQFMENLPSSVDSAVESTFDCLPSGLKWYANSSTAALGFQTVWCGGTASGARRREALRSACTHTPETCHQPSEWDQIAFSSFLDLYWSSPESGDLWRTSGGSKKSVCLHAHPGNLVWKLI